MESLLELRRLAVAAETAGVRVATVLRVNRAGAALPGTPPDDRRAHAVRHRRGAAGRGGRAGLRAPGAAAGRVPPARGLEQPRRRRARRVRGRRGALVGRGRRRPPDPAGTVNVGGGFGIDYTGARRFDLDVLAAGLAKAADALPAGARLVFELGRYLAADAGWYAAEVLDLKRNHGRWFAVLRGGTHHFRLPAAWGYSHPFTVLPVDEWAQPYDRPEVRDVAVDASVSCARRATCSPVTSPWTGCASATCWCSAGPARTDGTSRTTSSCATTPRASSITGSAEHGDVQPRSKRRPRGGTGLTSQ